MFYVFLLFLAKIRFAASFNDFPSLMITNASMAVVIERPFFELKAVKRRHATRNAYEKKLEAFVRSVTEAARTPDSNVGIEISVFEETSVNLARDYSVLLTVASCVETWKLFKRARKEKLVHLAITDRDCPRLPIARAASVPLVEPGQELAQMLIDLRVRRVLDWTNMNILHDRIFERDTIGRVVEALSGEIPQLPHIDLSSRSIFSPHSSHRDVSAENITETLKSFRSRSRSDGRFLVIVARSVLPIVLQSARSLGMLNTESQWLFVSSDTAAPAAAAQDEANVTASFEKLLGEGENIAFIWNATRADEDCREGNPECYAREMVGSLAAALQDSLRRELELYEQTTEEEFEAFRMSKGERRRRIVSYLREDLYGDRVKEEKRRCADCTLWKMLAGITWGNWFGGSRENRSKQRHRLIDAGSWTPGRGSSSRGPLFPHVKYGFGNKVLPIVTYHNPPWQYASESKENGKLEWDGLVFDIVNELSDKLNFTYKLIEVDETSIDGGDTRTKRPPPTDFSSVDKPSLARIPHQEFMRASTSSGGRLPDEVTELVRAGKVFMGACASSVTERLGSSLNFTLPISVQTYSLLTSRPKALSRVTLFASPYTSESWACLAGAVLLTGPILYLVHKFSPSREDESIFSDALASPARCLWYVYGALLQQGGMRLPENDGARLIVGTWWLVVMVIVATYSGSLVAFLTFPRMGESVSSLEDLDGRKDTLTWSLPAKSYLVEYLTRADRSGPYDRLLGDEARPAERHDTANFEAILDRVKEGRHVLIDWTSSLGMLARIDNPLIGDGLCHFSIGTETFLEESIALIFPSGSPYRSLIDTRLKAMKEAGLIDKWTKDRIPTRDECWEGSGVNDRVTDHKVDVWDMQGIFFVLFLGYTLALAFLAWEFLTHWRSRARERKIIRPFLS